MSDQHTLTEISQSEIQRALWRITRGFVRLMVEGYGVSYPAILEHIRASILLYLIQELGLSQSEIYALTGLSRKEISKVLDSLDSSPPPDKPSPALKVIQTWWLAHSDAHGKPRVLTGLEFAAIVHEAVGVQVRPTAIKNILKSWGVVKEHQGRLSLVRDHLASDRHLDRAGAISRALSYHIDTCSRNLTTSEPQRLQFERYVHPDALGTNETRTALHARLNAILSDAHDAARKAILEFESENGDTESDGEAALPGVGFYAFTTKEGPIPCITQQPLDQFHIELLESLQQLRSLRRQ